MCRLDRLYDGVSEADAVIVRGTLRSQCRSHRRKGVPQLIESNESHTARQSVIRYRPIVDLTRAEHGSRFHLASNPAAFRGKAVYPSPSVSCQYLSQHLVRD